MTIRDQISLRQIIKKLNLDQRDATAVLSKEFVFNDGGRLHAGYRGIGGDCVCRAIAIATEIPYREVWTRLADIKRDITGKRTADKGIPIGHSKVESYMKELGFVHVGLGQWHDVFKIEDLPKGRLIAHLMTRSGDPHSVAVIDGVTHDLNPKGLRDALVDQFHILKREYIKIKTQPEQDSEEPWIKLPYQTRP